MGPMVKVLYFGAARDIAGKADEVFNAGDTASLRKEIFTKYPAMQSVSFRIALNRNLLRDEAVLVENDVIAILPPFHGG
ncbi:MAG: MoaD/ThiS family protein [Bacteroidales bacterium]